MGEVQAEADARLPLPLRYWRRFSDALTYDLGPGPRCIKLSWAISLQKGGTIVFCLGLMRHFHRWDSPTAWLYTALHGSYGLIWLVKEAVMPDPSWQQKVTVGSALMSWGLVLGPYWLAPFLLFRDGVEAAPWRMGVCTLVYALGVVTMIGSDCQKYFLLKERRGLITSGWFAKIRHPNYLGEMMLYGAFACLTTRPEPKAILAWVWGGVFLPNILNKEARMGRYPGWAAYKSRSSLLFPFLF